MSSIHPTAIIADGAKLGAGVSVGPYSVVGANVVLGDNVILHSHVVVEGHTQVGDGTEIFPFSSIGHRPQDKKFFGEASRLIIGKNNVIREGITLNPGTEGGGMITQIGDNNLFMAGAHVAHDCIVGSNCIFANDSKIAGHVVVGDGAILGGGAAVHQFVRIGSYAFIGGMAAVEKDVIPYGMVKGERASLEGLNLTGLKRRNVERERIHALRSVFKELFLTMGGSLSERAAKLKGQYPEPEATALIDFVLADTQRAFCLPSKADQRDAA